MYLTPIQLKMVFIALIFHSFSKPPSLVDEEKSHLSGQHQKKEKRVNQALKGFTETLKNSYRLVKYKRMSHGECIFKYYCNHTQQFFPSRFRTVFKKIVNSGPNSVLLVLFQYLVCYQNTCNVGQNFHHDVILRSKRDFQFDS